MSVVCTNKTGTLTQNVMSVIASSVSIHSKFVQQLGDNQARTNAGEEVAEDSLQPVGSRKHPDDFSIDQTDLDSIMSPQLHELFNASITVNSTAFADADPETGKIVFVRSKMETVLLKFAKELDWANYKKTCTIIYFGFQLYTQLHNPPILYFITDCSVLEWSL